jgi:drug/metabolite transporter (DMT)-like permease
MSVIEENRATVKGGVWAMLAVICFSTNDTVIKFLSDDYALHQVVLFRSIIGLTFLLGCIVPFMGGLSVLKTKRLGIHIVRGLCVVFANVFFFLGLAAMPLADAVAVFFVSPLIITVFSVVFLKETVGPRRWAAIFVGLLGVIVVLRPGSDTFQYAALFPLAAAFGYATLHTLTRQIGGTENAVSMAFYIQLTFIVISAMIGLGVGDGRFSGSGHPSLEFLFRGWFWPDGFDLLLLLLLGITSSLGGMAISQAYRISEAAFVAPFEYIAMPLAVLSGLIIFGEWPDPIVWLGIAMIVGSGLVLIWREAAIRKPHARPPSQR